MKLLHQVKSQLKEKLDELPTQEELQKKADNFIAQLPNYKVRTSSHEQRTLTMYLVVRNYELG